MEEGALLARRLAGHLFTVWKDEASIAGPRGSDERNVSSKRNRHSQIEYPPFSAIPVFLLVALILRLTSLAERSRSIFNFFF